MTLLKRPFRLGSMSWPPTPGQWKALSDMIDDIYQRLKESVVAFADLTLSGDVTSVTGGSADGVIATTLATVNGNVGTFGSATKIPTVTVNAKGLVTAASETTVVAGLSPAQVLTRVVIGT